MTLWIDELDSANKRDMSDKGDMRDLRDALDRFLADAPSRARWSTLEACRAARNALSLAMDRVDEVWN